ncbi:hypothetical protein R6V09_44415 [Streptomyces sp. W16]|uniref:acyl-CoA-like ligand-binding transcription factor n=1 Tax=Streptomyces sp. W16 TaxID=3076631 RepID=UPI00295C148E|nr:hypothetical protein [Streptomyces sp. W16]MDV9177162.1 hypothetical protein [Streptomyces sp. W16]
MISFQADWGTCSRLCQKARSYSCLSVDNADRMLRQIRLILGTPALPARHLERQSQRQAEITGILARRAGPDSGADLRPALTAARTALSH